MQHTLRLVPKAQLIAHFRRRFKFRRDRSRRRRENHQTPLCCFLDCDQDAAIAFGSVSLCALHHRFLCGLEVANPTNEARRRRLEQSRIKCSCVSTLRELGVEIRIRERPPQCTSGHSPRTPCMRLCRSSEPVVVMGSA